MGDSDPPTHPVSNAATSPQRTNRNTTSLRLLTPNPPTLPVLLWSVSLVLFSVWPSRGVAAVRRAHTSVRPTEDITGSIDGVGLVLPRPHRWSGAPFGVRQSGAWAPSCPTVGTRSASRRRSAHWVPPGGGRHAGCLPLSIGPWGLCKSPPLTCWVGREKRKQTAGVCTRRRCRPAPGGRSGVSELPPQEGGPAQGTALQPKAWA